MRVSPLPAALLLALTLSGVHGVRAQTVVPFSYNFSISPNANGDFSYPDGGSELTDSTLGLAFSNYSKPSDAAAWVGWFNADHVPTINFQFDSSQTFSRIMIGTARYDSAAIGLPSSVTISGTTFEISSTYFGESTDARGWLVLDGTFPTTFVSDISTISIQFGSSYSQWLMFDEVQFSTIPEPATTAAATGALLLGATLALRRRRLISTAA